jgi:hypothetical protein
MNCPAIGSSNRPAVPERHAVSGLVGARFQQRIFHPGHLLQHGIERPPNHRRAHALAAKITDFLDLKQIEEGIVFARPDQASLSPTSAVGAQRAAECAARRGGYSGTWL